MVILYLNYHLFPLPASAAFTDFRVFDDLKGYEITTIDASHPVWFPHLPVIHLPVVAEQPTL